MDFVVDSALLDLRKHILTALSRQGVQNIERVGKAIQW